MPDESYSFTKIQDFFEHIIKKQKLLTDNPSIQIYVNRIKNRIVFKIKTGYKLETVLKETMELLGSAKKTLIKIKADSMSKN